MQTVFYTTIIAVINTTQYLIYDKVTYKQKLKTNQIQLNRFIQYVKLYGCIYKFWYMPRKCIMSATNYTFNERNKKGNTFYKSLCICTLISQISSPRTYKIKFKQSTTICPKFKLILITLQLLK